MKNPRLLVMAISFIVIGICGIIVTAWFDGKHMPTTRVFPVMDTMMDGGMMNHQQVKPAIHPPGAKQENLPERDTQGAKFLSRYCTQCHELPSPRQHSAEEWPAVVERMQGIMRSRGKPELTDNEKKAVTNYLIRYSR